MGVRQVRPPLPRPPRRRRTGSTPRARPRRCRRNPPARRSRGGAARQRASRRHRPRCRRASRARRRGCRTDRADRSAPGPRASAPRRARCASSGRGRRPRRTRWPAIAARGRSSASGRPARTRRRGCGSSRRRRCRYATARTRRRPPRPRRRRSRRSCTSGFHGLRVMPCSGQSPGDFQPNSVVVVLPMITAPAAFSPTTAGASSVTGVGSVRRLPRRVGKPATSTRSFTVHGTPSSGPSGRPAASAPRSRRPPPARAGSAPRRR